MSLNKKLKNWNGINVWLIGASNGIGRALCVELLKKGAYVFLSARSEEQLIELKMQYPDQSMVLPLDVLDIHQIQNQFSKIKKCDLVIYMAADYFPLSITNFNSEHAARIIDVNLKGATNISSVVLPNFIDKKSGHLSFVASIAGFIGLPHSSIYGATKAALINLSESFYQECKIFNVDVSVVNPGFVDTNLTKKNTFSMPFLMTPEQAAKHIIKGYEAGDFAITFPKIFSYFFRMIRILPYSIHLRLMKLLVKV
jgi:short-subunit dehydrogenase